MTRYIPDLAGLSRSISKLMLVCTFLIFPVSSYADEIGADEYKVAVGDTLSVEVFGHEDLSGECNVDSAGRCSLPLIKFVEAAGLTASELEAVIEDQLKPDYLRDPQVRIEITGYRPVFVLGEVRNPGGYPYSIGMTVVNAVALAGGYTYRARRNKIVVARAGEQDENKERIGEQDTIFPGDVIEIPERFF